MGSMTTLAATSYDWVGGNFAGLLALQGQCAQVASIITGAGSALSRRVSAMVGGGQLEQQGVAVNRTDGTALPDTTPNGLACLSLQAAAANAQLAAPYMAYRAQVLGQASAARAQAALSLNAVAEAVLPGQPDWGDPVNGLDAVRGLWAVRPPTAGKWLRIWKRQKRT